MARNRLMILRVIKHFAIILFIIATVSFILFIYNKINLTYLIIINISIGFIEMGLILLVVNNMHFDQNDIRVLIPKGKIDHTLITAKTRIFQKNIIPTSPIKDSIFRVSIELSEKVYGPLEFSIMRMCDAGTSEEKIDSTDRLNEGLHSMDIKINPKEKLNFMFDRDVKVEIFEVEEFYIP